MDLSLHSTRHVYDTFIAILNESPHVIGTAFYENKETFLHRSIINGLEPITRELIERGSDLNAKTTYGSYPLSIAAKMGNIAIVKLLVEKGADIQLAGLIALLEAIKKDYIDICIFLLSKGVELVNRNLYLDNEYNKHLTYFERKVRCDLLYYSYINGPHPKARWFRRGCFLMMLYGCGFLTLKDKPSKIHKKSFIQSVFGCEDLVRIITSYI
jgi:ankyrin repeat protein